MHSDFLRALMERGGAPSIEELTEQASNIRLGSLFDYIYVVGQSVNEKL